MRAMRVVQSVEGPVLKDGSAVQPAPGVGELLIRVCAAGVTTTELPWYPTSHNKDGSARVGAVPGHEFSGVVPGAGDEAGRVEIGQDVFGMNDWFADGALAEFCIAPLSSVAAKPRNLSHAEAASVPIGALTAWQGLFDHAKLQSGERVLVHGGAGAVGVFAIQLARLHGAHVIATASAGNLDFVASLGAEKVIDYKKSRFEDSAKDVDVVFDTVGGETLERSWGVLGPRGRLVTIASSAENTIDERVKEAFFIMEPNRKQLTEVAEMLEAGRMRAVVDTVIPLSQAPDAFAGRVKRSGRGKIVVEVGA